MTNVENNSDIVNFNPGILHRLGELLGKPKAVAAMMYFCDNCDKQIDLDFDVEHPEVCKGRG